MIHAVEHMALHSSEEIPKPEERQYRCSGCGALKGHSPTCPLIDFETAKQDLVNYHKAWVRDTTMLREHVGHYRKQVTFWQGKHALLRHENNQLRKRLLRQQPLRATTDNTLKKGDA